MILATPLNMALHACPKLCIYSPHTDEQYSADPANYCFENPDIPILDSEDEPMILAIEEHRITPLGSYTVVGLYADNYQQFAFHVTADGPLDAAEAAHERAGEAIIRIAGIFVGEVTALELA